MNRQILVLLPVAVVFCLLLLDLSRASPGLFTTCASQRWLGIPCPLCGVTRGIDALIHADFQRAAASNPLTIPIAILAVIEFTYRLWIGTGHVRDDVVPALRRADVRVHVALGAAYVAYALWFIVRPV